MAVLQSCDKREQVSMDAMQAPVWNERWEVLLADGTDAKDAQFAVPVVDTAFVAKRIDHIRKSGGGGFFLLEIDSNAGNNAPLMLHIPAQERRELEALQRRDGEGPMAFKKRVDRHKKEQARAEAAFREEETLWGADRKVFLEDCRGLLERAYRKDHPEHGASDVIGAFNKAFNILREIRPVDRPVEKVVIAFTDAEHNLKGRTLQVLPEDVIIIVVNPSSESTMMCFPDSAVTVVAHPASVADALMRATGNTTSH